MKKIIALTLCLAPLTAIAKNDETRFDQPARIAYFNPMGVFQKSEEVTAVTKNIQTQLDERLKTIQEKQQVFAQKNQELNSMGSAASDAAREAKRNELLLLEQEIKIAMEDGQRFEMRKKQEVEVEMAEKMKEATTLVRQELGVDIVLAGVVDADPKFDITTEVADQMNKAYALTKKTTTA